MSVNVSVNQYDDDASSRVNYYQGLSFSEKAEIQSDTWTGTGNQIDGLMARIREAINGE